MISTIPSTDRDTSFRYVPLAPRRAPQRTLQKHAALFTEYGLFAELLDAIATVLMVVTPERQVVYSNRALLDLLGLSEEQVLGMRPGELLHCVNAQSGPGGCGTAEACRVCGTARAIVDSFQGQSAVEECRIVRTDGGALDLHVSSRPITVRGMQFVAVTLTDISAKKRRDAMERIFFHDVLNLAGVLIGYADMLDTVTHPEDVSRIQAILVKTSERLTEEIKMQRDLLSAEQGHLRVHPVPVSSRTVLSHVLARYGDYDDNALVLAPDAIDLVFESDPVLLERVLGNLVKNALEASLAGQTVTLDVTATDDEISFYVHNETVMPAAVQLQVFQRSFSTKGHGRGLGTYSIKLLTEHYLQGSVMFTSSPDHGTTFIATYPRLLPQELPEGR